MIPGCYRAQVVPSTPGVLVFCMEAATVSINSQKRKVLAAKGGGKKGTKKSTDGNRRQQNLPVYGTDPEQAPPTPPISKAHNTKNQTKLSIRITDVVGVEIYMSLK